MRKNVSYSIVFLILLAGKCFASGYTGDLFQSWKDTTIVVLGSPKLIEPNAKRGAENYGTFKMYADKAYKGWESGSNIIFTDRSYWTTASVNIYGGADYVYLALIYRSEEDGKLYVKRAFKVKDGSLLILEAAIKTITEYLSLSREDRGPFLMKRLAIEDSYTHRFIMRETVTEGLKESIPYFRKKLSETSTDKSISTYLWSLKRLGDPILKETVLAALPNSTSPQQGELIRFLIDLKDPDIIPLLRKYIFSVDELIAVQTRAGLLKLGDPKGKTLLLDVIRESKNKTARGNAIHALHWGYNGGFTDEEMRIIGGLVDDEDAHISRVSGFIIRDQKKKSNKAAQVTPNGAPGL